MEMKGCIRVKLRGRGAALCLGCRFSKWNGLSRDLHCMHPALPWYGFERLEGCSHREQDEDFDPTKLRGVLP